MEENDNNNKNTLSLKNFSQTLNIHSLNKLKNRMKYFNPIYKKNKNNKKQIIINKAIIYNNIKKYNSEPSQKNLMMINNLLALKETHFLAVFKDQLIDNSSLEFLRRFYNIKECNERMIKFYSYYKNYLLFFCQPIFSNFYVNELLQDYGQNKAEIYYNEKYKKGKEKEENNNKIYEVSIFTDSIKSEIEKFKNDSLKKQLLNGCGINDICPSSILLLDDSNNSSKSNNKEDNSILNIIQMITEKTIDKKNLNENILNNPMNNYLKTYINAKEIIDVNEHIDLNSNISKNHKINLLSIKKSNDFINNKDIKKINEPLTSRIHNNSKIKLQDININNMFPKNYNKQFNSQNKIIQSKNKTIENWRINNNTDKKDINYNNINFPKGYIYLNSNKKSRNKSKKNKYINYLSSLSNTKTYKNLKINTQLLSKIKSPKKKHIINTHKNSFKKNFSNILNSIKNTVAQKVPINSRSLSNTIVNNFNININNHIVLSNSSSPSSIKQSQINNIISKSKRKSNKNLSRNYNRNLFKVKTDINNCKSSNNSNSNSQGKKAAFWSFKNNKNETLKVVNNNNYYSLRNKLPHFNQKAYSLKTIAMTSRKNNKKVKSPYSLKVINNNNSNNNKKNIISSYKNK